MDNGVPEPATRGNADRLRTLLRSIDGKGFGQYKRIRGSWSFPQFQLDIRHVQGDPFAAPSRCAVVLTPGAAAFPGGTFSSPSRRVALSCQICRRFRERARALSGGRGSGKSGRIGIVDLGQLVVDNTGVLVSGDGGIEARFTVGLPATGRRILASEASRILTGAIPGLVDRCLRGQSYDLAELEAAAAHNEDVDALRGQLAERGLVAFIADGAILPRKSGVDQRPLPSEEAVPFQSPPSLRVTLERPNGGPISGLGVRRGVTLLVGGGYHGKSTVLNAVTRGVYNHLPSDGRQLVVTARTAVKVQAEDGRAVTGVDISPFIGTLPGGRDTRSFTTANASGSTSQAASIIEAWEAGSELLLIDEDSSATNFMIRDHRMQVLVPSDREPITPFIDRVRSLHQDLGVSTLLVVGGSGDYLDVADQVIGMVEYVPQDLTEEARRVAGEVATGRMSEGGTASWARRIREPDPITVDPSKGRRPVHVRVRGSRSIDFGTQQIDLDRVSQLVLPAQARTAGLVLARAQKSMGRGRGVIEVLDRVMAEVSERGMDILDPNRSGELVMPRLQEAAAALNRLRSLRLSNPSSQDRRTT